MSSPVLTSQLAGPSIDRAPLTYPARKNTFNKLSEMPKEKMCEIKDDDVDDFYLFPLPSKKRIPEARYQERLAKVLNRHVHSKAEKKHRNELSPPPAPTPISTSSPKSEIEPYKCSLRRRDVIRKGHQTKYASLERHRRKLQEQNDSKLIEPQKSLVATQTSIKEDKYTTMPQRRVRHKPPRSKQENSSQNDDLEFTNAHCAISFRKSELLQDTTRTCGATCSPGRKGPSDSASSHSVASSASQSESEYGTVIASPRMTSSELVQKLFKLNPEYNSRDKERHTGDVNIDELYFAEAEKHTELHTKLPKSNQGALEKRSHCRNDKLLVNRVLVAIAASTTK